MLLFFTGCSGPVVSAGFLEAVLTETAVPDLLDSELVLDAADLALACWRLAAGAFLDDPDPMVTVASAASLNCFLQFQYLQSDC